MAESLRETLTGQIQDPREFSSLKRAGNVNLGGGDFFATHEAGQNRRTYTSSTGGTVSGDTLTTKKTFEPIGPKPTYERPVFDAPEFDDREIAAETQRLQSPSIRKLRRQLQQTQTQRFDNPNVRRMTTRAALAGFGAGLESIQTGARREARQTVQQKYARQFEAVKTQFAADVGFKQQAYQRAWDLYLKSGTTKTIQKQRTSNIPTAPYASSPTTTTYTSSQRTS